MDTQNPPLPPENDDRPYDQQERAASANLNPNDPAVDAKSPQYGEFGGVIASQPMAANYGAETTNAAPAGRDGSNDNPDEFSEFRDREKDAQKAPDNLEDQPGHVTQNQDIEGVRKAQASGADDEELRAAWAKDDPRYAGGGTHNTREESASTKDGQE